MRIGVSLLAFCLVLRFSIQAQESATDRLRMATNQLKQAASEISARCLTDVGSLKDWKERRPEMRSQLLEMLGLGSPPERTALRAVVTVGPRDTRITKKSVFKANRARGFVLNCSRRKPVLSECRY